MIPDVAADIAADIAADVNYLISDVVAGLFDGGIRRSGGCHGADDAA